MEKTTYKTHGTAMSTKVALAFANIFMTKIENKIPKLKKSESC